MNTTTRNKISLLFILTCAAMIATGQGGVSVRASVDRNSILIGEHFTLRVEAEIPENEAIRFFDIDSLPHFEFLDKQKIDTTNTSTGTVLVQQIRMTSFDSGHWVIPRFFLDENFATDSIPMDIGFSSPFDSSQAYHDIKDVIDVAVEEKKNQNWLWIVVASIVLLGALWFLLRKKPAPVQVAAAPVNAYEEAMKEIGNLEKNKPATKQYYSSLVDIFRVYVARKKGIHSLQKTTDDLVVQLKGLEMHKDIFDKLAQALRLSDFVKFAKYEPAVDDDRLALETVRQSIREIEQVK